ncbi:hypothetical protein [Methylobacterium pseudosasicola]|uniref:Uncharacterized protein n=1 Tax=Methylobacterium pseudosasicola TaxID=582667 RepID=A0A1I4UR45_9HYPH|nr:hypothetical protein [Methylobacterium pseudosasicola]SFM91459.1 hypothetical protein SAMN05192568_107516 [Methylobacterium pseudosasicola]
MTEDVTFRSDKAAPVQLDGAQTDFTLPICLPDPELMVGEALAVLVVTTVEGQQVGVPMGVNGLEYLLGIVEAGLRVMREDVGGAN